MIPYKAYMKRALVALFLPFLSISCSIDCHQWEYQKINTTCYQFDFAKLSLSPTCEISGLELELSRTADSYIRMYINVFTLNIPQLDEIPGKAVVTISVPILQQTYQVLADVLEGGQRLLLPEETAHFIIECLLNEYPITIQVGRYSSDIILTGFLKGYLDFQSTR